MFKTQLNRPLLFSVVVISLCAQGCHRSYYRRQADAEAQRLICQKSDDPRWNSSHGTIDIDPQSRMFNPFSEDHPPIPPDDPTSNQFMHCVDGKPGYPHWNANGNTNYVANPEWRAYLPINEQGQVVIDMERAYQLAVIHSPDLQGQRETLYLSALDVSLERFRFDTQLFAGFRELFTARNGSSTFQHDGGVNGGGITLEKLGITGTTLVVGLANSILWNFAGPNSGQSATTLVDFAIVQPLLSGAGRQRIMESLTQAERTLLANVRQLDRFRRGFYLEVVAGRSAGSGPIRSGNFLGLSGGVQINVDGFLGLLQQQQQIRIQEFNVRQLENELERFREFYVRERIDSLQVRQFENSLYSQQRLLLTSKTNYQNSLDRYKVNLGLPPDLDVIISDPILDQFELLGDELTQHSNDLTELKNDTGNALISLGDLLPEIPQTAAGQDPPVVEWPDDLNEKVLSLETYVDQALELIALVEDGDMAQIRNDLERLDDVRPRRIEYLKKLRGAIERGELLSDIEPDILQPKSIRSGDELRGLLELDVKKLKKYRLSLEQIKQVINGFAEKRNSFATDVDLRDYIRTDILESIPEMLTSFSTVMLDVSLLQAQARTNSVELADVQLDSETAFRIARCFRRDLMNARASLVDQWRQIDFVADQLEAQLDLIFNGDAGYVGRNPFNLRYDTGSLQAGFRFDAPIVRLAERNQYRQALINYQQSKRAFYQFEDEINRNLRQTIRSLDVNRILYEVNRKSIQISIEEVELAQFKLEEPARPGANRSSLGATTANDLTRALNGLQTAQLAFLDVWVNYEVLRRNLDFDLGTMQVDSLGRWIDPVTINDSIAERAAGMMGMTLEQMCCNLDLYDGTSETTVSDNFPNELGFEQDVFDNDVQPSEPQNDGLPTEQEFQNNGDPLPFESDESTPPPESQLNPPGLSQKVTVLQTAELARTGSLKEPGGESESDPLSLEYVFKQIPKIDNTSKPVSFPKSGKAMELLAPPHSNTISTDGDEKWGN